MNNSTIPIILHVFEVEKNNQYQRLVSWENKLDAIHHWHSRRNTQSTGGAYDPREEVISDDQTSET